MNAIATINFQNYLHPKSKDSMLDAARRWGATFFELIPEKLSPWSHASYVKLHIFDLVDKHCERIFLIDSDVMIRSDCPSPFDTFSDDVLVATKNCQSHLPTELQRNCLEQQQKEIKDIESNIGTGKEFDQDKYFNCGVLLLNRKHHTALFELSALLCRQTWFKDTLWREQSMINHLVQSKEVSLEIAPNGYNFTYPKIHGQYVYMNEYILHMAGIPKQEAWKIFDKIDWRL